jgi:hypothetical protein
MHRQLSVVARPSEPSMKFTALTTPTIHSSVQVCSTSVWYSPKSDGSGITKARDDQEDARCRPGKSSFTDALTPWMSSRNPTNTSRAVLQSRAKSWPFSSSGAFGAKIRYVKRIPRKLSATMIPTPRGIARVCVLRAFGDRRSQLAEKR